MPEQAPLLCVEGLRRPGLEPFDLTLSSGEAIALVGPSGAGKSLLLRAIADLDTNEGEVRLGDRRRDSMTAPEWRRRVTYLAAEPAWWATWPADHFPDAEEARNRLADLGLDEAVFQRPMAELSTGERQRLALIRVLLQSPTVLLLDEPTGNLDAASVELVERQIRNLLAQGKAILFTTHDERQAKRLTGRILRIATGGRVSDDSQSEPAPNIGKAG